MNPITGPVTDLAFRLRGDSYLNIRPAEPGEPLLVRIECQPIVIRITSRI